MLSLVLMKSQLIFIMTITTLITTALILPNILLFGLPLTKHFF